MGEGETGALKIVLAPKVSDRKNTNTDECNI